MAIPHEPATPSTTSRPSRSLIPSPTRNRRDLTYGSSTKSASREGYGIVSAAGLDAWRRGPKAASHRASTSTATTATTVGGAGVKRKGLGMGLESTPGRKKFKRFSKASKPSIGTESTPKTARSRSTLARAVQGGSVDRSRLSELSSNMPSSVSSASARTNGKGEEGHSDPFAVAADTIVGEDVFGLTVAIDPDGTLHGISPPRMGSADDSTLQHSPAPGRAHRADFMGTPPGWPGSTQCFCGDRFCPRNHQTGEGDKTNHLIDMTSVLEEDQPDVPAEVLEMDEWIDEPEEYQWLINHPVDRTIYWDTSVPLHDSSERRLEVDVMAEEGESDFGAEFTYDDEFVTMLEDVSMVEHSIPLNDVSIPYSAMPTVDDPSMIRRRTSRDKIASRPKTPRRATAVVETRPSFESEKEIGEGSIELSRGLKLSKPQADVREVSGVVSSTRVEGDEAAGDDGLSSTPAAEPRDLDPRTKFLKPIPREDSETDEDEVEGAERVRQPSLDTVDDCRDAEQSRNSEQEPCDDPSDPYGFHRAQKAIRRAGIRPRRYRATSELETPPRVAARSPIGREFTESRTASPVSKPRSHISSSSTARPGPSLPADEEPTWRGAWRGGRRSKSRATIVNPTLDVGDDSFTLAKKVFHEPQYSEEAERAKDARVAHYDDLKTNYSLHIKSGYF